MTRWLSSVLPAVFVLAVALVLTGCGGGGGEGGGGGGGGDEAEQVKVASDIAYPPFEFNKGGEPTGFDIDLMNEIAKRANLDVEYQNVRFDSIIQGLGNNLYDAAISAMTITPEREEQIDFSEPYFNADQSLLVQSDSDIRARTTSATLRWASRSAPPAPRRPRSSKNRGRSLTSEPSTP